MDNIEAGGRSLTVRYPYPQTINRERLYLGLDDIALKDAFGARDPRVLHQAPCFRFRDSGSGIRVSGFGVRDSGFGSRSSGFGIGGSGCVMRDAGFGFRVQSSRFAGRPPV